MIHPIEAAFILVLFVMVAVLLHTVCVSDRRDHLAFGGGVEFGNDVKSMHVFLRPRFQVLDQLLLHEIGVHRQTFKRLVAWILFPYTLIRVRSAYVLQEALRHFVVDLRCPYRIRFVLDLGQTRAAL